MDRNKHLAWCKKRALVYVDAGHLPQAVASFGSDMANHPDIIPDPARLSLGLTATSFNNAAEVRRWIEGFK
jgi:hypothetical protein